MVRETESSQSRGAQVQVEILGIHVDDVTFDEMMERFTEWVDAVGVRTCRQVCTVNPEFVVDAQSDPEFAAVLARSDLRVADGVGIMWAARRLGHPLRERITGSDGIYAICARAAQSGWRVFFLGAGDGVAAEAARRIARIYPDLAIAGSSPANPSEEEWPALREQLDITQPDILFVAYGHPRQDFWIDRHRDDLPAGIAIGVGGALDFVAGVTSRAPAPIRRVGLEWLYRLISQPWRWRRMTKLPVFVMRVLRQANR